MTRSSDVRASIESAIRHVLEHTGRPHVSFEDENLLIVQLGLDSLDLAQVVVMLEQQLGVDPFRTSGPRVRTFGDLVRAYQTALESAS